eukprot:1323740-Rhodomonas_salina.1
MEIFNSEVMDGASAKTVNTWVQATEEDALGEQVVSEGSDPCPNTQNGDYSKASFADSGYACEAGFMTSILGDSEYSRKLAKDFVGAIRTRYDLNGRYTRAFWINPGGTRSVSMLLSGGAVADACGWAPQATSGRRRRRPARASS